MPVYAYELSTLLGRNQKYLNYIKKTVINKLGKPYNECEDNKDNLNTPLANEIRSRGSEYKQGLCFNLCRLYYIQDNCNCSLQYQLWNNGNDTCDKGCVRQIIGAFDYGKNCQSCPLECDSVFYETRIKKRDTSLLLYDDIVYQFSNYTLESTVQNLTVLNFNFEDMYYTQIKETPLRTFTSLIGELGGTLG